mgnify:CR=1 FL=1
MICDLSCDASAILSDDVIAKKEGICMICRRCGCMLDKGTRICPFCGEPVVFDETGRRLEKQDDQAMEKGDMPELVPLKELAPVPGTRRKTLAEIAAPPAVIFPLWMRNTPCWRISGSWGRAGASRPARIGLLAAASWLCSCTSSSVSISLPESSCCSSSSGA